MIRIEPCAGLGNRFLALASAYWWAKDLNEELVVLWKEETCMGAAMQELFTLEQGILVENVKDYGYKGNFFKQIEYNLKKSLYKKQADGYIDCEAVKSSFADYNIAENFMKSYKEKYIRAFSPFYNLDKMQEPFSFMKPSTEIIEKSKCILKGTNKENRVGVHIRRTDNAASINNSPLEAFISIMHNEIKENEDTTFYLASDDNTVISEMLKLFGDRIIYMKEKSFDRDSVQGIKDAYVELICLSETKKIYGSFASTYSKIASMLSGIPLNIVSKENNV